MGDTLLRVGQAICRPAIRLIDEHHRRKQDIEEGLRRDKPPPHSLKRRKRALTWNTIRPQDQSPLLAKLPYELRQLIWKECVGGMTVHLKIWNRRLGGICCRCPNMPWCKHLRRFQTPDCAPRPLGLLLSCHQVYSEATKLLYSQNIFKILNEDCLSYLPQLILPQRINTIRSICFQWFLKHAPDLQNNNQSMRDSSHISWASLSIWKNLASLQSLEHLWGELDIHDAGKHEWIGAQSPVFEPLKAVTRPKVFILLVPFCGNLEHANLKGLPCQIHTLGQKRPDLFNPFVANCTRDN